MTGSNEEAISSLRATVALGDTPYLEDAKFYLAKAYLRRADIRSARSELLQVVELHGEREQDARALLARLDEYVQQEKGARR